MSLFRAREWWSTKVGENEEFDRSSMVLGNVDNNSDESIKIVTGSFQGMLRVHHPAQANYRIEDLLLEHDLGAPILQVSIGRFIPAAPHIKAIAVLHPRKLGVYTVEAMGGKGAKASYFDLVKAYEHVLGVEAGGHFTAYNMTYGGFGGVSRDLLSVQSMDGRLQVFEQDAHAFTRRLHRILAPGPVCYVAKVDAFVVGNSNMGVDCYKYQALAASQEDREERKNEGISAARGLQSYWSCQLGEPVFDIFVAKFSRDLGPGGVDIVVLGERTLFTLREQGTVRLQKFLGYQPVCITKYVVEAAPGEEGAELTGRTVQENDEGFASIVEEENLIIGTDSDQLMMYKDLQLVWQATLNRVPVTLAVAKFGLFSGMVCSLDEGGVLSVCYQGTDPPTSAVVDAATKEMDYEHINQEHRKLLQVIRRSQTDSSRPTSDKVTLRVRIPRFLDGSSTYHKDQNIRQDITQGSTYSDESPGRGTFGEPPRSSPTAEEKKPGSVTVTARFVVTYTGMGEIRDATLNITPPSGISAEPSSVLLPLLRGIGSGSRGGGAGAGGSGGVGNDPFVVAVVLRAERETGCLPSTLLGQASVVCTRPGAVDGGSEPMTARCNLQVPLNMAARVVEPIKGAALKFTFNTNQSPVPLLTLFDDVASTQTGAGLPPKREVAEDSKLEGGVIELLESDENGGAGNPGSDSGEAAIAGSTALTFRYWAADAEAEATQDVRVVVSKHSGRYQVQSQYFPALCLMALEVVRRLGEYFGEPADREQSEGSSQDQGPRLSIEYSGPLPLQEFYAVIDEHFERRRDLHQVSEKLNCAAHQYRVVEKRLLSRFKQRNPSPLDNLDVVSEETYSRLVDLAEELERAQGHLAISAGNLGCATRFVALLAKFRFQLPSKDYALLLAHLIPDVIDSDDQGWEESVDAAMTHLLRTSLAKVAKDSVPAGALTQPPLSMPEGTVKVKKHISIVLDRLNKGARLALRPAAPPSSPRIPASTGSTAAPFLPPPTSPRREKQK